MAQTKKKKAPPPPPLSEEELAARVRSALADAGLKSTELARTLGKENATRGVELARELARKNELYRIAKGSSEWFFGAEPIGTLDRVSVELLRRDGPLGSASLKKAVQKAAPGHDGVFAEWLQSALSRGLLHERPGKPKTLALEPDLAILLKKPMAELDKLLGPLEAKGISRERIADFFCERLGVAGRDLASPAGTRGSSREVFLEALRRFAVDNPKGALLPVRELRVRAGLGKQDFDAAALALSREGLLVLHQHDHSSALSEADQNALVRDALGRHYIGVALRGSA